MEATVERQADRIDELEGRLTALEERRASLEASGVTPASAAD